MSIYKILLFAFLFCFLGSFLSSEESKYDLSNSQLMYLGIYGEKDIKGKIQKLKEDINKFGQNVKCYEYTTSFQADTTSVPEEILNDIIRAVKKINPKFYISNYSIVKENAVSEHLLCYTISAPTLAKLP